MLNDKNIVLGVCGSIAAYKALDIVSGLKKLNANVDVIMTESAAKFVTPLSFQSLSHNPVIVNMFDEPKTWEIQHISLAKKAQLFIIGPASASIIGKVANGIADDMLSTTIMAAKSPVLFCPAMNTAMYDNPILQNNIKKLKDYGYVFMEPAEGRLACGDTGRGKLADVDSIIESVKNILLCREDYIGQTVLVTAGPTIEPIDPVRYITNHSSGKMGYAIAERAKMRGANVILISGPTHITPPHGVEVIKVNTNREMYEKVLNVFPRCNIIIKAAAVADYRPSEYSSQKIKKNEDTLVLHLEKNVDILRELGRIKGDKILVGFAAESENLVNNAKAKIEAKNLDMIVANDITCEDSGFNSNNNKALIIDRGGNITDLPKMSKAQLADTILDNIAKLR